MPGLYLVAILALAPPGSRLLDCALPPRRLAAPGRTAAAVGIGTAFFLVVGCRRHRHGRVREGRQPDLRRHRCSPPSFRSRSPSSSRSSATSRSCVWPRGDPDAGQTRRLAHRRGRRVTYAAHHRPVPRDHGRRDARHRSPPRFGRRMAASRHRRGRADRAHRRLRQPDDRGGICSPTPSSTSSACASDWRPSRTSPTRCAPRSSCPRSSPCSPRAPATRGSDGVTAAERLGAASVLQTLFVVVATGQLDQHRLPLRGRVPA